MKKKINGRCYRASDVSISFSYKVPEKEMKPMQVLTEEEMAQKLDFRRPLNPPPEERETAWCIPFEYGANQKGTRISISKAKQIIGELRAEVAEAEKRELYRAFKKEENRSSQLVSQYSEMSDRWADTMAEVAGLKQKIRNMKKRAKTST